MSTFVVISMNKENNWLYAFVCSSHLLGDSWLPFTAESNATAPPTREVVLGTRLHWTQLWKEVSYLQVDGWNKQMHKANRKWILSLFMVSIAMGEDRFCYVCNGLVIFASLCLCTPNVKAVSSFLVIVYWLVSMAMTPRDLKIIFYFLLFDSII